MFHSKSRILSFVICIGILLYPHSKAGAPERKGKDQRLVRLQRFFADYDSPVRPLSAEFIRAADVNGLDWRLLPSIALIESGGGKEYRNNNILGWGNGAVPFHSVKDCIHTVANRLAESPYYRDKSLDQMLYTYNPVEGYRERVKRLMRRLGKRTVPRRTAT